METMNNTMCTGLEGKLAELLLDSTSAPETVKTHVESCAGCREELAALRSTMSAMDVWEAPAPNPYFMTRFAARLREEKTAAPASWFEKLKARWTYGQQLHTRPLAAMALTVAILVGGGAYMNFYWDQQSQPAPQTAVVHDLQTLDSNAQLLDQLESISTDQSANQGND